MDSCEDFSTRSTSHSPALGRDYGPATYLFDISSNLLPNQPSKLYPVKFIEDEELAPLNFEEQCSGFNRGNQPLARETYDTKSGKYFTGLLTCEICDSNNETCFMVSLLISLQKIRKNDLENPVDPV